MTQMLLRYFCKDCDKEVYEFEDYCSRECFLKRKCLATCLNKECSNRFYQWGEIKNVSCSKECFIKTYKKQPIFVDDRLRVAIKFEEKYASTPPTGTP
jgi:hypothetical protein